MYADTNWEYIMKLIKKTYNTNRVRTFGSDTMKYK